MIEEGHTGYVVENFRIINTPGQPEKRERYHGALLGQQDQDRPRHRRSASPAAAHHAGAPAAPVVPPG